MKGVIRFSLSLALGCVIAIAIAGAETLAARAFWPAYAAAEPHKSYTLLMLFTRLAVGALSAAVAACGTTAAARDNGRAARWLGVLFVVLSVPSHVYPGYSLKEYPVWYHVVYLSYLVPVAGLSAWSFRRVVPIEA